MKLEFEVSHEASLTNYHAFVKWFVMTKDAVSTIRMINWAHDKKYVTAN